MADCTKLNLTSLDQLKKNEDELAKKRAQKQVEKSSK
jgi:hypothetical protein